MDTLIQLRQPQLSKKPDEAGLIPRPYGGASSLPSELLGDVAEAFNQLEEDRNSWKKPGNWNTPSGNSNNVPRLRRHLTRRQARELRQAQTAFDNASEEPQQGADCALHDWRKRLRSEASMSHEEAKRILLGARARLETCRAILPTRTPTAWVSRKRMRKIGK